MVKSGFHLTCVCGYWLRPEGRGADRVWCAGAGEELAYEQGRPTRHDVYSADGRLLTEGHCRAYVFASQRCAVPDYYPLLTP